MFFCGVLLYNGCQVYPPTRAGAPLKHLRLYAEGGIEPSEGSSEAFNFTVLVEAGTERLGVTVGLCRPACYKLSTI